MDERSVLVPSEVLDSEELMARCMGNMEFAQRVLEKFQASFGADLEELERSVASRDAERITRIAHRLKGSSSSVSAHRLSQCAREIEHLGRALQIDQIPGRLESLRGEWARFVELASSANAWS